MRRNRIAVKLLFMTIALIAIALIGRQIYVGVQSAIRSRENWRQFTTPLPASTIEDLCQKLGLVDRPELCSNGAIVYAGDFYPFIREHLPIGDEKKTDYRDVMLLLGDYMIECEPPVKLQSGEEYYRCLFDLRGDDRFRIGAYFSLDDMLFRLSTGLEWP